MQKGIELYENGEVLQTEVDMWEVKGSEGKVYVVSLIDETYWHCPCPDAQFRDVYCKHIWGAIMELIGY